MSDTNITDYYPETPEPKSEVPEVPEVPAPETDDFSVDLPDIPLPDMEEDFDDTIKDALPKM